jgi:phosphatidylserine decarboxylase
MSRMVLSGISQIVGWFVRLRFPKGLQRWVNQAFVWFTGINMGEAERSISEYDSIQDLFTRRLRAGIRPTAQVAGSPADGVILYSVAVEGLQQVQAKGLYYQLDELVFGSSKNDFQPAWCSVVYLAPHNYHRVHSPLSGTVTEIWHLPGQVWSVAPRALNWIPNLYSTNERLVFKIEIDGGEAAYVVMVGALNVARMETPIVSGLRTNRFRLSKDRQHHQLSWPVQVGDELGTFLMGSTVVILWPKSFLSRYSLMKITEPQPILVGNDLTQR